MHEFIEKLFDSGYSVEDIGKMLQMSESEIRERHSKADDSKNDDENKVNYVKLSLDKYEEMKNKIDRQEVDISYLESEIKRLSDAITKLGIPGKIIDRVGIDIPLSCYWKEYFNIDPSKVKHKYRIEFEVDPMDLIE